MQRVSSENQGECWHAKSRKRMKERETTVGVEKSRKTFSLKLDWQLRQEEHSVA
jgi:hypothetical protein